MGARELLSEFHVGTSPEPPGLQEIALAHWRQAQDRYVFEEEAAEQAKIQKIQSEVTGQLQDWLRAALPEEWVTQAKFTTELVWPYVIAHLDGVNFTVTPVYGENHLVLVERCPNCGERFRSDSIEGLESLGQQIDILNQGWRPGHTCDPELLERLNPDREKPVRMRIICPLMSIARSEETATQDCMRGECGWWSEQYAACGIRTLANIMAEKNA